MLDEKALRGPRFTQHSVPIRLSDGQEWSFPKPIVEIHPVYADGRLDGTYSRTTHGPEFDEAVDALTAAESNSEVVIGIMTLGAFLLRKNYALTDEQLEDLFVFRFGTDEENDQSRDMVQAIADVALGRGVRSFRDGGDSA